MKSNRILAGDIFKTNDGGAVKVISFDGCYSVTVQHLDFGGHTTKVAASHLRSGRIKNPYKPRIFGIGYVGSGIHKPSDTGRDTREYTAWVRMLERAYCKVKQSHNKSYIGCSVDPLWHNFQNFADWYKSQVHKGEGYQLDKDILIPGNKVYGPNQCRLVPEKINKILNINPERRSNLPPGVTQKGKKFYVKIGKNGGIEYLGNFHSKEDAFLAYKKAREEYVRSTAEDYRYSMPEEIYLALVSYVVNIED